MPELQTNRAKLDAALMPQLRRVWDANWQVYGADKVWKQMNREGIAVARCTVERLMNKQGLCGVRRGKVVRTTTPDTSAPCPLDRVNRQFTADRPNQLWVSDFTQCPPGKAGCSLRSSLMCLPEELWVGV